MKKLDIIKIVLIVLAFIGVIILGIKFAIRAHKKDMETINYILSDEGIEKAGEATKKATTTLKEKKDAFMKGYNKSKEDTIK